MALSSQQLWQKYITALTEYLSLGQFDPKSQAICFAGNTLMVDLANADPEISSYNIYNIGNVVPKWSPAYAVNSDLIGSYSSYLNYIDLGGDPNPNLDSQINIAAGKVTSAAKNFEIQVTSSRTSYAAMKAVMPNLTWVDYIQQYGATYTAAKGAMDSAQMDYSRLLQKKSGTDFQSLLNAQSRVGFTAGARDSVNPNIYNMKGRTGTVAPAGSTATLPGQDPAAPATNLTEMLLPRYNLDAFATAYGEWQTKSVNNQVDAGPIVVSGSSSSSQFSDFGWDASVNASLFGDFFSASVAGNASGQTIKNDWQSTDFSLSVSFTGLQTFNIEPFNWFQPSFITNYHDKLLPNAPKFFGENGSLSLLPQQVIIGYEPKIELTLSNSDYADLKSSFQASVNTSVNIGPFRIGSASASTYGSKENVDFNDSTNTITTGPVKTTLPLLLGVICSKV